MSRDDQPNKEKKERGPHPGEPLFPARHNYTGGRKPPAIVPDTTEPLQARENGAFSRKGNPVEKGLGVMFPSHFRGRTRAPTRNREREFLTQRAPRLQRIFFAALAFFARNPIRLPL